MPLRAPEFRLRSLVAKLASTHADDVQAILDALDEHERDVVEGMLLSYADVEQSLSATGGASSLSAGDAGFDGFSFWLADRLARAWSPNSARERIAVSGGFEMTAYALRVLGECASEAPHDLRAAPTASRSKAGSLFRPFDPLTRGRRR